MIILKDLEAKMNNKLMTHSEVKKMLFKKDQKLKKEYDALAPRYE